MRAFMTWAGILVILLAAPSAKAGGEMYPITDSDKAFFWQIRKALLADDIEWLSGAVDYPIRVRLGRREIRLRRRADAKKHASLLLNEHLKSVVRDASA